MKSESTPLISVVIPNYNYGRYLKGRIESVLNQTFTDYELILLDDASTDDSVKVMEEYKEHPKVSLLVVNDNNTGSPFQQWIKGILLARGTYIWMAEADDLAEPIFLETCVNYLNVHADTSVCFVGSKTINAAGEVGKKDINHWGGRVKNDYSYFDGKEYAEHNLYWKNYIINASGVVFRREYALNLINSPFQTMRYCGDWLFWFEMAMQGGVIEVYKNLNYFRMHEAKVTQKSHNMGGGVIEDMQVLKHIEQQLPNLSTYKKRLRRGLLYRKIKKGRYSKQRELELFSMMEETLTASFSDYRLERINQFLRIFIPTLLTRKRDRL